MKVKMNPTIISDTARYQRANIICDFDENNSISSCSKMDNKSQLYREEEEDPSSSISFYIVCEKEIVGRYGNDISSAMHHLQMFGRVTQPRNRIKKEVNRAIIPVINHRAQNPSRSKVLERYQECSHMAYCFWQDGMILKQMQDIVQNEYDIMFPPSAISTTRPNLNSRHLLDSNAGIILDVPPELRSGETQSMKIRGACVSYFKNWAAQLSVSSPMGSQQQKSNS